MPTDTGHDPAQLRTAIAELLVTYERRRARNANPFGLHRNQLATLLLLRSRGEVTPRVVRDWLAQSAPTTTYVIDQLVARGLVTRHPHPTDRRSVLIEITSAGVEVSDELIDSAAAAAAVRATQRFTPEVVAATIDVLHICIGELQSADNQ